MIIGGRTDIQKEQLAGGLRRRRRRSCAFARCDGVGRLSGGRGINRGPGSSRRPLWYGDQRHYFHQDEGCDRRRTASERHPQFGPEHLAKNRRGQRRRPAGGGGTCLGCRYFCDQIDGRGLHRLVGQGRGQRRGAQRDAAMDEEVP